MLILIQNKNKNARKRLHRSVQSIGSDFWTPHCDSDINNTQM